MLKKLFYIAKKKWEVNQVLLFSFSTLTIFKKL